MNGPVIVVFGITGDLSQRKLIPALYHLLQQDKLPSNTKIVGISRRPLDPGNLLETVRDSVTKADGSCSQEGLEHMRLALTTHKLDPASSDDVEGLKHLLDSFDTDGKRERLFYMSIPAKAYAPIVEQLANHGLNDERSRLLLEKPFGDDLASARDLITLLNNFFGEEQIYRIDHYLAKETAQNLLTFRLHNPIFIPLWSAEHIQRVRICAFETIGVEGRGNFYEQTGALRDLIQSHLMQLLAITLMDLPLDMSSAAIHLSKEHFLEQLKTAEPSQATRAQYEGYRQEVGNPNSTAETFARVHLQHTAERWQGTDIILETGKALSEKTTTVVVEFKTPHERRRNNLTFQIQPNEGIGLGLIVKEPGLENRMHQTALSFHYDNAFENHQVDAYERVLIDAVRGDQALFASNREVLATWRVLQPVLDAWNGTSNGLAFYPSGSDGAQL